MKSLTEYLTEAINIEWQKGTIGDFIDCGAWIPNDDLTKDECKKLAMAFYNKYPANHNDNGVINNIEVKCEYKPWDHYNGNLVYFTFYWGKAPRKDRIKVIEEIVNLMSNTVYSVVGDKHDIEKLLDNMSS